MKSYYRPDYEAHQAPYHRARRRRSLLALAWRGAAALAIAGVVGLAAAAWASLGPGWVRARLSSLNLFTVETMLVGGNRSLSGAAVLAVAQLRAGESLLGLDLESVRARLAASPWIREASVRRRFPGTLLIEIVERVPCVVVRAERDYLVDAEGAVIAAVEPGSRTDLPVLTGVEMAHGALSARGAADVAAGVELVAAIREAGFPALSAVAAIDLADPEDALIVPVSGRPLVHAGRRSALERLRRWRSVAPDMAQRSAELEYVDLRAEGLVVAMPAAPPPDEAASGPADQEQRGRGAGAADPAQGGRGAGAADQTLRGRGAGPADQTQHGRGAGAADPAQRGRGAGPAGAKAGAAALAPGPRASAAAAGGADA